MKNIESIFIMLLLAFAISCQDDYPELGNLVDKSGLKFTVKQDLQADPGGNTIILINETPQSVAIWDYGTGRSNRQTDTIRVAFKGEYTIKFSALTGAGIVQADPVTVTVTDDNLMYVNDPLWTALSGGVGNSKTWLLDLDAEGKSKYFDGPLYFYGTNNGWQGECQVEGGDCWNWNPEYAGNTWLMPAGDYGTMTFNLQGGPFVTASHAMIPDRGAENGTYFLDVNSKTLSLSDVAPLHDAGRDPCVNAWGNIKVFSLTEDAMQLAVLRTSCEGPCLLVYNYISKEYSDNWVPEEPAGDPNFDHGNQLELLSTTTTKTWKFDLQVPYNWTSLTGDFLNNWNSRADIVASNWAPYGDADVVSIDDASISFSADGKVVIVQDNGTSETGDYSVDEATNMITFSGITPVIPIAGWVSASTTDENQWKIVKVEKSELNDAVTGIWFGKRDPTKSEYMVFHFVIR